MAPPPPQPQVLTALDIVTDAMREIGVLDLAETPQAAEAQNALRRLNWIADSWSARRSFIYAMQFLEQFTLIPNHSPHTIGPQLADFLVPQRPVKLESAAIYLNSGNQLVKCPINVRDADWWANQRVPLLPSTIPTDLYYEPTFPNGSLYFWPIPSIAYPLELEVWQSLPNFPTLTTPFWMPPGYLEAVTLTLAVSLTGLFEAGAGTDIQDVRMRAAKARATIQGPNSKAPLMRTADSGIPSSHVGQRGDFNWLTGGITK